MMILIQVYKIQLFSTLSNENELSLIFDDIELKNNQLIIEPNSMPDRS